MFKKECSFGYGFSFADLSLESTLEFGGINAAKL
jgi:hypothetical protein